MEKVVKEKDLKCFEWNVTWKSGSNFSLKSESFFFNKQAFNLRVCEDNYYGSPEIVLYCERDKSFTDARNIIINVTSSEISDTKMLNITRGNQELWRRRNTMGYISINIKIEVIFKIDVMKETGTSPTKNASQGKISSYLEENIHFQALSRDFSKLLKEADGTSDVTITCEGKTFRAHKNVLETRSAVLCAMLKSDMVEGKTGLITLKDIKIQIFESFLLYLYTGNLPELSMDNAKEFYKVGDQYAVEELKRACSEFMIKNLSESNACEVLVLADLHSDKDFRKKIITYIVEKDIPKRDSNWSDFCERHCILAVQVLNAYITKR